MVGSHDAGAASHGLSAEGAEFPADFERAAGPLRSRLLLHCYRMLGSVQDAEDLVQETYLRAWKAYHTFEGRSSLETWMTSIATRSCLNALRTRERRVRPVDLSPESADPLAELESNPEIPWLEPLPDARWRTSPAGPEASALARETLRLAFVSALQRLTAGQRAVVLLRDVLGYSAAEAADTLGVSEASANSSLQRARARLKRWSVSEEEPARTADLEDRERDLVRRYVSAFEANDLDAVVALLQEDAIWEMPPFLGWYAGRETIGSLIRARCPAKAPGDLRFVQTTANCQPAPAAYLRGEDGVHRPFQIHVLDVAPGGRFVRQVSCYFDLELFAAFGLPETV